MPYQTESDVPSLCSTAVRRGAWIGALFGLAVAALCGLSASSAGAAVPLEQTGVFAGSASPLSHAEIFGENEEVEGKIKVKVKPDEEIQLGGVGSLAVNRTGAGGVPKGTVYAVTGKEAKPRVAMFEPKSEAGLKFVEGWEVSKEGEYERCGPTGELPDGESSHPVCPNRPEGDLEAKVGLDVDEETGDVYVYADFEAVGVLNPETNQREFVPGVQQVAVYSADGGEIITRFAEQAPYTDTIAMSPEKAHADSSTDPLAVDSATGVVYIYDQASGLERYHRLMVFEPEGAGDYAHYKYAGEVLTGTHEEHAARAPAVDDAGHLYAAGIGEGGNRVEEYATPPTPAPYPAPEATPTCSFTYAKGGMTAFAVDPTTGESFFYSYKRESSAHWVRRLGPCEGGTFEALGKTALAPERGDLRALAFDPERSAEPLHAKGVLYGAAPGPTPESGEGEPGQTALGYIFGGPVEERHPPMIESESVGSALLTTAQLRATVNPDGYPTRYSFQYEDAAEYEANPPDDRFNGAQEAPTGGALAGEGSKGIFVAAQISGLDAGQEYRFRVVATNLSCSTEPQELCVTAGAARTFRTFASQPAGLPDQRAWELVSPSEKFGGQVFPVAPAIGVCPIEGSCKPGHNDARFPRLSAPTGEAVVYEGGPFSGTEGGAIDNEYLSRRGPTGWETSNLTPPALQRSGGTFREFAADLSRGVVQQPAPALSPSAPTGYPNLYAQYSADPSDLTPVLTTAAPHRVKETESGSKLILNYAGVSSDGSRVFFEANDALTPAVPGIAPAAPEVNANEFDLYEWHEGNLALVSVLPGNTGGMPAEFVGQEGAHGLSDTGSSVFFKMSGRLYVRIDGRETRPIEDPGSFVAASTDGSRALLSNGCLYDIEAGACIENLTQEEGGLLGVAGQAEGLARVYFVDTKVLDETPNSEGEAAAEGANNLYAWSDGSTRFIARLLATDNAGGVERGGIADWVSNPSGRTAVASPSGRYLAFMSTASLTGYENVGPCLYHEGVKIQLACSEVFLYDSEAGTLKCVSCNPTNAAPFGGSVLREGESSVFSSGRLYFDSRDSLSPYDTNDGYEDVYQYEPQGVGTCTRVEGCVALLSSGRSGVDSNLLAVDSTGANVFFTTRDALVPRDSDEQIDLYDAREHGGFPSEDEASAIECQGEACQAQTVNPATQGIGSANVGGEGGSSPEVGRSCPKGKVREHKRCVTKHKKKAKPRKKPKAKHSAAGKLMRNQRGH